jgi:Arc/MetJ-type ribon-helix-helix transcriptional regulator
VVQLVLPPSWVARINQLAVSRGVNRSALIREAIRATYFDRQDEAERGNALGITHLGGQSGVFAAEERRPADEESAGGTPRPADKPAREGRPHRTPAGTPEPSPAS